MDQGAADGGTLLHDSRKLSGIVMAKVDQAGQLQEIERAFMVFLSRQAQHFDRQHHVVENGAPLEQDGTLKHHPDLGQWPEIGTAPPLTPPPPQPPIPPSPS